MDYMTYIYIMLGCAVLYILVTVVDNANQKRKHQKPRKLTNLEEGFFDESRRVYLDISEKEKKKKKKKELAKVGDVIHNSDDERGGDACSRGNKAGGGGGGFEKEINKQKNDKKNNLRN